jgi:CRISPR-associated protein Csh1
LVLDFALNQNKERGEDLRELLDIFKTVNSRYGDECFIGKYEIFFGYYIKIDKSSQIVEVMNYNKKTKAELKETKTYEWFRERDFYSTWINSNKAVNGSKKKIQSINCYSMFLKREHLSDKSNDIFEYLNKHFIGLAELIKDEEDNIKAGTQYDILVKAQQSINDYAIENNIKDGEQIKIFLEEDIENYKHMAKYYYEDNRIFLSSNLIECRDKKTYGIPNFSASYDVKKTFIKPSFTKMPALISNKDAYLLEKLKKILPMGSYYLTDLLKKMKLNDIIEELDNERFDIFIEIKMDNGIPILTNYEIIEKLNRNHIYYEQNICTAKTIMDVIINEKETNMKDIRIQFDNIFCEGKLYILCFGDKKSIYDIKGLNKDFKTLAVTYRNDLINYFYKNQDLNIYNVIKKLTDISIIKSLTDNLDFKVRQKIEYSISLKTLFRKEDINLVMQTKEIIEEFNKKLKKDSATIESDDEYYYILGQVTYYLSYQSKSNQKTGKLYHSLLQIKTNLRLKEQLVKTYEKYCYSIFIHTNYKINKAISFIMSHEPKDNFITMKNKNMFILGLTTNNCLFEDKKKES